MRSNVYIYIDSARLKGIGFGWDIGFNMLYLNLYFSISSPDMTVVIWGFTLRRGLAVT